MIVYVSTIIPVIPYPLPRPNHQYRNGYPSLDQIYICISVYPPPRQHFQNIMGDNKRNASEIKARIKQQGKPSQITQLNIGQLCLKKITPEIKKIFQACSNLRQFSLTQCDLETLENFPIFKYLVALDISTNNLTDSHILQLVKHYKRLKRLSIGDNKISSLDTIKQLKAMKQLEIFECEDNPVASKPQYTQLCFDTFPLLKYLDGKDESGTEILQDGIAEEQQDEDEQEQGSEQQGQQGQQGQDDDDSQGQYQVSDQSQDQQQQQEGKAKKKKG